MGRGTFDVLTAWTPLGDFPMDHGGLMVLEGSHQKREEIADYLSRDVDSYCVNGANASKFNRGVMCWEFDVVIGPAAAALRRRPSCPPPPQFADRRLRAWARSGCDAAARR